MSQLTWGAWEKAEHWRREVVEEPAQVAAFFAELRRGGMIGIPLRPTWDQRDPACTVYRVDVAIYSADHEETLQRWWAERLPFFYARTATLRMTELVETAPTLDKTYQKLFDRVEGRSREQLEGELEVEKLAAEVDLWEQGIQELRGKVEDAQQRIALILAEIGA
tara:strand:- start:146 stop:640 length:495 start_codon:yes stop_codon:yes gene_type:complete